MAMLIPKLTLSPLTSCQAQGLPSSDLWTSEGDSEGAETAESMASGTSEGDSEGAETAESMASAMPFRESLIGSGNGGLQLVMNDRHSQNGIIVSFSCAQLEQKGPWAHGSYRWWRRDGLGTVAICHPDPCSKALQRRQCIAMERAFEEIDRC